MDTTIRNIDEGAYRALKAWAAHHDMSIGEALSEMIRAHVSRPDPWRKSGTLLDLPQLDFGKGSEHTSDEIDAIVYGT